MSQYNNLFSSNDKSPRIYFYEFFHAFNWSRSIADWYILLNLVMEHLKSFKIDPIVLLGNFLNLTCHKEMLCYLAGHRNLAAIHDFWQHLFSQEIFLARLPEYFQLVEQCADKSITATCVYGCNQRIIKLDSSKATEKVAEQLYCPARSDYGNVYIEYTPKMESELNGRILIFTGYNPEQLERFKSIYIASTRRFQNTKPAKN